MSNSEFFPPRQNEEKEKVKRRTRLIGMGEELAVEVANTEFSENFIWNDDKRWGDKTSWAKVKMNDNKQSAAQTQQRHTFKTCTHLQHSPKLARCGKWRERRWEGKQQHCILNECMDLAKMHGIMSNELKWKLAHRIYETHTSTHFTPLACLSVSWFWQSFAHRANVLIMNAVFRMVVCCIVIHFWKSCQQSKTEQFVRSS